MRTTHFGNLQIGEIPRVVGTLSSFDSLARFKDAEHHNCDIAEVRLDEMVGMANDCLVECKALESLDIPIIFTIRLQSEGGKWLKLDKARLSLFEEALKVVSAVDVEFKSSLMPLISTMAKSNNKAVVVSFHDFEKTPPLAELKKIAEKAAKHASLVKISTMIKSNQDVITLQQLLACDFNVPMCVIGMGSLGTKTRVAFPSLGSSLTYGFLDTPSAPGQLSASALVEQLRMLVPAFNEDFIGRKQILEYA